LTKLASASAHMNNYCAYVYNTTVKHKGRNLRYGQSIGDKGTVDVNTELTDRFLARFEEIKGLEGSFG